MNGTTPVSLVIVSFKRPYHLDLCLKSLCNQTHTNFEIIVVSDALPSGFADTVKFIPFDTPNISIARNLGISASAGDIIAFCDDDAIPDPPWLKRLVAPFIDTDVGSVGGFTRGRNGISRQWGAARFDLSGQDKQFEMDETLPYQIFDADTDTPVKLIGTNMAFRKKALLGINGFDQAFRFYLEDADVKLRLDKQGWKSALVPNAEVHHSFAASDRRTAQRIPTDLFEIGASQAYFCKKHMKGPVKPVLDNFTEHQCKRVKRFKVKNPDTLLQTLKDGFEAGLTRVTRHINFPATPADFKLFKTKTGPHVIVYAGPRDTRWATAISELLNTAGCRVTVLQLSFSILHFYASFQGQYWLQKGGVFGRSLRSQPLIAIQSFHTRTQKETARISSEHSVDYIAKKHSNALKSNISGLSALNGHNVKIQPF